MTLIGNAKSVFLKIMIKLTIKTAENGYMLIERIETEPDFFTDDTVVFEEGDNNEGITALLTEVADRLGFHYDKWKDNNINITFNKKGHKVD